MVEPIVIKAAGYQVPASVHNRAMRVLERELVARLGDRIRFDFVDSVLDHGQTAGDLYSMVEDGRLTLVYQSTTRLAARIPEFALLDLPFMFRERSTVYGVLDGAFGTYLQRQVEATTPFRILGYWDNGFRHLSNRMHPIAAPADCAGLRIRTQFSEVHQRAFRLLGFEPMAIDVSQLTASLESVTVDAQDNALTNIFNFDIYRNHPYVTLSAHTFGTSAVIANAERLAALGPEVEGALRDAVRVATTAQRELAAAEDAAMLARLTDTGVTITRLTEAERAAFLGAVAPLIDEERERFGTERFAQARGGA